MNDMTCHDCVSREVRRLGILGHRRGARDGDDPALGGGLPGGLDNGQPRDCILRIDWRGSDAAQRLDHAFVESSIRTGLGWHRLDILPRAELPRLLQGVGAESEAVRSLPFAELRLLGVHSPLHVCRTATEYPE